ncbi:hypothetical protein BKA70DRAFT_1277159 [Coprinopsis sp. MPI-PUGE-AT-0042]|nr:hypothetical protein BKA70DRAFT_1277159 [Coprinopsis sp. MPI-PUGE-AT-0042]
MAASLDSWSRASVLIAVSESPDASPSSTTSVAKDERVSATMSPEGAEDSVETSLSSLAAAIGAETGGSAVAWDDAGVVSISSPAVVDASLPDALSTVGSATVSSGFIMLPSVVVEASTGLSTASLCSSVDKEVPSWRAVVAKGGLWEDLLFFLLCFLTISLSLVVVGCEGPGLN